VCYKISRIDADWKSHVSVMRHKYQVLFSLSFQFDYTDKPCVMKDGDILADWTSERKWSSNICNVLQPPLV